MEEQRESETDSSSHSETSEGTFSEGEQTNERSSNVHIHEDGTTKKTPRRRSRNASSGLENILKKMVVYAYEVLNSHFEKIEILRQKCHHTHLIKAATAATSMVEQAEKSTREIEDDALRDKMEELMLQKEEFQKFLRKCIKRMRDSIDTNVNISFYSVLLQDFEIECSRLRECLPIYARRSEIVGLVRENQVSIILGETGSGKSTQIVQYMNQAELGSGIVACTQPRKVAALSLAERVASELHEPLGKTVAYQVGMKSNRGQNTKILFMTDQLLLHECLTDEHLGSFSTIIIDEAHERSIYTDILLGMIKNILPKRHDLRVVITSATMDPYVFVKYFRNSPIMKVSGRMFPVEIEWSEKESLEFDSYEERAIAKVFEVHKSELPGDILLFLTSPQEIERCSKRIKEGLGKNHNALVLELHGKLQADEQQKVFCETPIDKRKIVLATNVAETSVTIQGIKYVIDTGVAKEMRFDPKTKISSLDVTPITQSSAEQRKGRAGRTSSGKCFRLYSAEDYHTMRKSSPPEILRVDLGHAILKLLQLGVDPLSFDFVEPPSEDAMKSAYAGLEQIEAISEKYVTKKGKVLAKLPLTPVLGSLVYEAIQLGLGSDGIVLAACFTKGSSLFYRSGTDKDKAESDKSKLNFCQQSGDHMTFFQVFKEWNILAEKEKGKWCKENFINGKVAKSIKDTVKEVQFAVKKELHFRLENSEDNEKVRNELLQSLLFKTFKNNLCYFLGHTKAGYFLIDQEKSVAIHPSSAILTAEAIPEWTIIEQILNTTREYAINVTAVRDVDIDKAIESGELKLDKNSLQQRKMVEVHSECLGLQSLKQCRCPRRILFRKIEEREKCIIEEDYEQKQLSIFATKEKGPPIALLLRNQINDCQIKIQKQKVEAPLVVTIPNIRALMGAGGILETILYPTDFVTVNVYARNKDLFDTDTKICHYFQTGESAEIKIQSWSKIPNFIGQITFKEKSYAQRAVENFHSSGEAWLTPNINPVPKRSSEKLEVHISWIRRPLQGIAFVKLTDSSLKHQVLRFRKIVVNGVQCTLTKNKKDDESICIKGLSQSADENSIKESIKALIGCTDLHFEKVLVPREKTDANHETFERVKTSLISEMVRYTSKESFQLNFKEPKVSDFKYEAFATFHDQKTGREALDKIATNIYINGQAVNFRPKFCALMFMPSSIFSKVENILRRSIEKKEEDTEIKLRQKKNGDWSIEIKSTNAEQCIKKKNEISNIIKGDILEIEHEMEMFYLSSESGQKYLQSVMRENDTEVLLKNRNRHILVYGIPEKRENTLCLINEKLKTFEFQNKRHLFFELKGKDKHPGLLKAIIQQCGSAFASLKSECQLEIIQYDHQRRCLFMAGDPESVSKCKERLKEIELSLREGRSVPSNLPDCCICFCEIQLEELYRLESCGHSYCIDCIKFQIESTLQSNDLPLRCADEACGRLWSWLDIDFMIGKDPGKRSSLVASSVSAYVMNNKDTYSYCVTPDCPIVYRITDTGDVFQCPACNTDVCSTCRVEYHSGMTCAEYKSCQQIANDEEFILEWIKEDPNQRKQCPKCKVGIEKNGGCNRMICASCKCIMCWVCSETFTNESECYSHLRKEHGSIYPDY